MFGTSQSISGRIGTTRFTMEGFQIWEMLFSKLEPNFEIHSLVYFTLEQLFHLRKPKDGGYQEQLWGEWESWCEMLEVKTMLWFPVKYWNTKKLVITFFWCFSNSLFFQLHAAALSSQKFRLCEGNNATAVLPVFFQLFRGSLWLCVHVNCFHLLFKELVADRDFHCNKCHVYQKQLWTLKNEIISSPF